MSQTWSVRHQIDGEYPKLNQFIVIYDHISPLEAIVSGHTKSTKAEYTTHKVRADYVVRVYHFF